MDTVVTILISKAYIRKQIEYVKNSFSFFIFFEKNLWQPIIGYLKKKKFHNILIAIQTNWIEAYIKK